MPHTKSKIVRVAASPNAALSRGQKQFNKLIKNIEQERHLLQAWKDTLPRYQQLYMGEFAPLMEAYDGGRAELLFTFDLAYDDPGLSQNDRKKLRQMICDIAAGLVANSKDERIKQLYNKHSGGDFDAESAEENEAMRARFAEEFGIDLGADVDFNSPDDLLEKLQSSAQKHLEQEQQAQEQRAAKKQRKKSAKQLEKEVKQQEEEKNVSLSIREVYRKLASSLHPDREQDEAERVRKTALMQRVNVAYQDKDLLKLLELQLEIEQIDQNMVNNLTEERLKYYNKVLSEQLRELQQENQGIMLSYKMRAQIDNPLEVHPDTILPDLEQDIRQISVDIGSVREDAVLFQDVKKLKRWLKTIKPERRAMSDQEMFAALFAE